MKVLCDYEKNLPIETKVNNQIMVDGLSISDDKDSLLS